MKRHTKYDTIVPVLFPVSFNLFRNFFYILIYSTEQRYSVKDLSIQYLKVSVTLFTYYFIVTQDQTVNSQDL